MTIGTTKKDALQVPLSSVIVDGISDPVPISGSANTTTTAGGDVVTPANINLSQIGEQDLDGSGKVPVKSALNDIVDLATLLVLAGAPGDANTVASFMGRLTKIRDLLNGTLTVSLNSQYPAGATPIFDDSGIKTNATATATIAAAVGKTSYLCGFIIASCGATAAAIVNQTIGGVLGGTKTLPYVVNAGVGLANETRYGNFNPGVPANAVNAAITVVLPALGAGNTHASVVAWGYQL